MASFEWRFEMENMLSAFNRQTIHSLSIIKLAFKRGGLSFTPEFKKYFMQASNNRISEAYDQFQVNLMLEQQLSPGLNSVPILSPRNGTNGVERGANGCESHTSFEGDSDWMTSTSNSIIQINDSAAIEAVETTSNNDATVVENGGYSNANRDEIEGDVVSIQSDTYDSNNRLVTLDDLVSVVLVRLDETASAATHKEEFPFHCRACFQGFPTKAKALAHEMQCQKRCYECYLCKKLVTCLKFQLVAHMRIHTGDKPFRCEICMKQFAQKCQLKKHLNAIHSRVNL